MTTRVENSKTYTQVFDAENRLVSVTVDGQTTQFVYNGDGAMVKMIHPDGNYVEYAGSVYEVARDAEDVVTQTTVYYPAGGAMRVDGALYYVIKDHLGSASLTLDNSGAVVGRQTYAAFGGVRTSSGDMLTDRLYTGQRALEELGIYYYNARWYDPYLNRFLSADTMVPGAADSQAYDRYSYSRNNPVKFVDPSGHIPCAGNNWDDGPLCLLRKDSDLSTAVENHHYQKGAVNGMLWDLIPSSSSITFGGQGVVDLVIGESLSGEFGLAGNWRSGEVGIIYSISDMRSGSTPHGLGLNGFVDATYYWGASTIQKLEGTSLVYGGTAGLDLIKNYSLSLAGGSAVVGEKGLLIIKTEGT